MRELLNIFNNKKTSEPKERISRMTLNDVEIEKVRVHSNKSHSATYSQLRKFKTPQYDHIFLFRNKKGFNTVGLNINYDIVICDKEGTVIETIIDKEEGFISKHYEKGYFIYFMVVGSINSYKINVKDRIRLLGILTEL